MISPGLCVMLSDAGGGGMGLILYLLVFCFRATVSLRLEFCE